METLERKSMNNPIHDKYIVAKKLDAWNYRVIVFSSAVVLVAFILSKLNIEYSNRIQLFIDCLGFGSILIVAILSFYETRIHLDAEENRRKMAIDNAFEQQFCSNQSEDYYTNDSSKNGIERLSANYYESCFFTYHIASDMLKKLRLKSIHLLTPFLLAIFLRDNYLLFLLANLTVVSVIISDWIRIAVLVSKTKSLLERFCSFYGSRKGMNSASRNGIMTLLILDYEAAVSWSHILLCEKVYEKTKENLGQQWDDIKKTYGIDPPKTV